MKFIQVILHLNYQFSKNKLLFLDKGVEFSCTVFICIKSADWVQNSDVTKSISYINTLNKDAEMLI